MSEDQEILKQVDAQIADVVADASLPPSLVEALRYAVLGPGKRIRPLLSWHACVAVGGAGTDSLAAGAAVEMVHAFSLVHDDLPALDNDDMRRGRPTLHRHAGEAMAVLAGDALLTLSFDALRRTCVEPEQMLRIIDELTRATSGMIAGQVYDSLGGLPEGLEPEARVVLIHSNKTGALIRASCVMGAMAARGTASASCEPALLAAVTKYGEAVGLMFQIVDDLLDVTQTSDRAGKRTGKDANAGKLTYPGILGIDGSRRRVEELLELALDAITPLGSLSAGLDRWARTLAARER